MSSHNWTKHISKTYHREYWFNKNTGKSVWVKPQEVIDYEKQKEEKQKLWEQQKLEFKREVEEKREKDRIEREQRDHSMQIVNGNGMSWTIEGGAHWTKQDYLDEIQNYNQAMRDF